MNETAAGASASGTRFADLADQAGNHHQIAGVGGDDRVEEALQQRALEEDLAVLGPEGAERGVRADPEDLEDRAEGEQGEQDEGEFAAAERRPGRRCGRGRASG